MAVDAWPGTLPTDYEKDSYSEVLGSNVVTSEPEMGPIMVRRRSTAVPRMVKASMLCTQTQYDTLVTFFQAHVALRFSKLDVRGNTRYYLFAEPPNISMLSGLIYRVELSLWEFLTETGGA